MCTGTRIKRVIPVALYTVFYLLCFSYLENRHVRYHIIDSSLDDKIPFCEYFIIPYFLWFLYITVTIGYFLLFNENTTEFWSLILNLAIGMTLFLIVSYLYPNGLNIRPTEFSNDSIFTRMVQFLYGQIHQPMYFQVSMCIIPWLLFRQYIPVKNYRNTKESVSVHLS